MTTILEAVTAGECLPYPPITHQADAPPVIPVGLDNGNDHAKLASINQDRRLMTSRIPTAYADAREVRGGTGVVTYRVNDGAAFWIGEPALLANGQALPIGSTAARLADQRQIQFLVAALVEHLTGQHDPGAYHLAIGLAIPNNEIVLVPSSKGERLGVSPTTRKAIKAHLHNRTFHVRRIDERNRLHEWSLTISQVLPQAQSVGSFLAWSRDVLGNVVRDDVTSISIIDVGGGDLQRTDIWTQPAYRMMADRLGDGTITLARALAAMYPNVLTSDALAQSALVAGAIRAGGRTRSIKHDREQILSSYGQDMIARMLPVLNQAQSYVLATGAGTILLRQMLTQRAEALGRVEADDFEILNPAVAPTANAIGALFALLFATAGREN